MPSIRLENLLVLVASPGAQRLPAAGAGGSAELVPQHCLWPVRRPVHWPEPHCRQVACPVLSLKLCSGREGEQRG